jgi:outer membrane lipoprotein SlyB
MNKVLWRRKMVKDIVTILITVLIGLVLIFIVGCESDAQTGAALGTLAGAGIGQIAGRDTQSTLIGAAVGGTAGYMLGNESDKRYARAETAQIRDEMSYVTVNITNSNGSVSQVRLRKCGVGYVGTRGEYYNRLPTEDQLRPIYGF